MHPLNHLLLAIFSKCLEIEAVGEDLSVLAQIRRQYVDYQVILHYDNGTAMRDLWEIFDVDRNFSSFTTFTLLNYDDGGCRMKRPTGYRFLHLVLLSNPRDFRRFSSTARSNLQYVDTVLFVIKDPGEMPNATESNYRVKSVWKQRGLDRCGSVVLYHVAEEEFYHVKFYSGLMSGVPNKMVTPRDGAVPDLLGYVNEFGDFNGHAFYVAYYPYAPFIWCESEIVDGPGCEVKGIEGNILVLLSKYLNFTFVMKHAESQESDNIWQDMIEDVQRGRRDWAVGGMSMTYERRRLVDFTSMLHMEGYTTFYVSPDTEVFSWDAVLKPFKIYIWIQLLVDIIFIGCFIKVISVAYNLSQNLHFVEIPFHVIVEQSILPSLRIRIFNLKLILSIWFLMSIIITTAYKSKLASTMIKPVKREPSSVLKLYDEGYTFQVNNEDWSVLRENLEYSTDESYLDILGKCNNELTFCEAVAATLKHRKAIIDEDTGLQYIILNICRNYTPYQMSRFRLVNEQIFPSMHSWPIRYGAPYKYKFSTTLQRLVDSGIIEHWYKSFTLIAIPKSNLYRDDSIKRGLLTISNIYICLLILLIGELLAVIVFIGEILRYRYYK